MDRIGTGDRDYAAFQDQRRSAVPVETFGLAESGEPVYTEEDMFERAVSFVEISAEGDVSAPDAHRAKTSSEGHHSTAVGGWGHSSGIADSTQFELRD